VRYGGNTVCVGVRTVDETLIVLDAGTGIRVLGDELKVGRLPDPIHLFITHGHWDHIIGAPFFAPLYRADARIVVHAMSPRSESALKRAVLLDGEHFPIRFQDVPAQLERPPFAGTQVRIGSATLSAISLNHPGGAEGFRIDDADGTSLCYLTDNELAPPNGLVTTVDELARFAHGADLVIHDAQYMPDDMPAKRGWGHSVVDEVLDLGRRAEVRTLALHHHDPWRDDHALDLIAAHARAWCRANAPAMSCIVACEGTTLELKR
jgi:phosphoribosyl 1,2-cyclic phosphodiesterase